MPATIDAPRTATSPADARVIPISDVSDVPPARDPIRTRTVGWAVIALFLALSLGLLMLLLQARRLPSMAGILTGPGWRENLIMFGGLLLIAVGAVIVGLGRLRAPDLGLGRRKLVEAAITIGAVWALIQLLAALEGAADGTLSLHRSWTTPGVERTLLWAAVMFLATATYEEIAFRGFLFPQLYLKFGGSHRVRFWTALLASQCAFALAHVPAHIALRNASGSTLWTQVLLQGIAGVLLLLLYLRTRNLWISIGFHGLANAPTPLVTGAMSWEVFLLAVLVAWPRLVRRPAHRGLARVEAVPR